MPIPAASHPDSILDHIPHPPYSFSGPVCCGSPHIAPPLLSSDLLWPPSDLGCPFTQISPLQRQPRSQRG
jgi:hypothetical protein